MTEKIFTEEDYQTIVNVADKTVKGNLFSSSSILKFWGELVHSSFGGEYSFIELGSEIMAIANPLTRDWAHEQFVNKEKKYYWTSKKKDNENDCLSLYKLAAGGILTEFKCIKEPEPLTESEIREWGYNPDMFVREEIY